ncbi:DMT family transporter [Methanobrevibacter sp.]|uniref:DMT family transporter n=1 Tax=Methanobrevibacter sp. TaxID=66852 RepID=UPI0038904ADD
MNNVIYLLLAILFEISATSLLKVADGFSRLLPTIASIILYIFSFYCLSNCLKTIPVGIAYAIWSALGIVLLTLIGIFAFEQTPDWAAILGLLFIIIGVIVLNLFSKMGVH